MITLNNITLRRGPNVLLKDINWTIYHKQRIGLIGPNGAGKTSLFSMLLKELSPDLGDLEIPKHIKMAHVAQETHAYEKSALDYVLDGDTELRHYEAELLLAEAANDGEKIGHLHEKLSIIDAYTANARAGQLLAGLGFTPQEQQSLVSEFSGGWRIRLNLAKALMCPSDVLLLDEPTNHLDLDAILWLEEWLMKYRGTLIMISHDRDFLDHTVDHIAHIHHRQLKIYTGNYSTFEKQLASDLLLQQAAFEKQQKQIAHMQSFINRFGAKASKARQAKSRQKAIERLELVSAVQTDSPFQFHFREPKQCPNPLIRLDDAGVVYGEKRVLKELKLTITPSDRIGILGPNGAGKSSLIKLLAAEIEPSEGIREVGPGLKIGYFAQHQVDHLDLNETPLVHMRRIAERAQELELRKYLGSFGFSGDRVLEPVKHFSGGEKSRLALALIIWQQPNLLLLDEPTNHLDLEMRHALSLALQEYTGAMILVSHDRFLVRTTTDKLMLVANQKLEEFDGDLEDYQTWLLNFRKQQIKNLSNKNHLSKKEQRQVEAKKRESTRPLLQKITQLEEQLAKLQKEENKIEMILTDATLYEAENKDKLQKHLLLQSQIKKEIIKIENEWLSACEERDKDE